MEDNITDSITSMYLLCILSKVLESTVYHKIISFIHPHISQNQFGFLKNHSCFTQLLTFATSFQSIDNNAIYINFKKANSTLCLITSFFSNYGYFEIWDLYGFGLKITCLTENGLSPHVSSNVWSTPGEHFGTVALPYLHQRPLSDYYLLLHLSFTDDIKLNQQITCDSLLLQEAMPH